MPEIINTSIELDKILKEMCGRVGAIHKDINFKENDWFLRYSWTQKQEDSFKDWLKKQLNKNKRMRTSLMAHPYKSNIDKFVDHFCFSFGWKIKEEDVINENN